MPEVCRRGWRDSDTSDFCLKSLETLHEAAADVVYLLNRGYDIRSAVTFTGNHFSLTDRQRMALLRTLASDVKLNDRAGRELNVLPEKVAVDGFNIVITLETALSHSPVFASRDGTIRDLAGLHGTYRVIDKTESAVRLMLTYISAAGADSVLILLDKQVSNSGRLGQLIGLISEQMRVTAGVCLTGTADTELLAEQCVITSDSVVLDRCASWYNLNARIIRDRISDAWIVTI